MTNVATTDENKRTSAHDVVIIGAGPAGLTAAYELSKRGETSTVLEADTVVGGISRTAERDGWRFDIGGHRFFTKVHRGGALWHEILPPEDFLLRPRMSRIYYNGKFFDYPLRAMNALRRLGVVEAVAVRRSPTCGRASVRRRTRRQLRGLDRRRASAGASTARSSRPTPRRCGACRPPRSRRTGPRSASRTSRCSRRCVNAILPKRNQKDITQPHRGVRVPEVRARDDVGALPRHRRGAAAPRSR